MKTTLTPHLRISPYKGSVATVQIQMPFHAIAPSALRAAHKLLIIYIRVVRRALNLLRASFSPIFQYFSAVNVTYVYNI